MLLSKKPEAYRIKHFAEEYIGDHGNMPDGFDGRILHADAGILLRLALVFMPKNYFSVASQQRLPQGPLDLCIEYLDK